MVNFEFIYTSLSIVIKEKAKKMPKEKLFIKLILFESNLKSLFFLFERDCEYCKLLYT